MLAHACAPAVNASTATALATVESDLNPYAIGVVDGKLDRQPRNLGEAIATARMLKKTGWNFSVGIGQINIHNVERFGMSIKQAFDVCSNLQSMQKILMQCYKRAQTVSNSSQQSLRKAFSCYYSNNFQTGFDQGYVYRVVNAALQLKERPIKSD